MISSLRVAAVVYGVGEVTQLGHAGVSGRAPGPQGRPLVVSGESACVLSRCVVSRSQYRSGWRTHLMDGCTNC